MGRDSDQHRGAGIVEKDLEAEIILQILDSAPVPLSEAVDAVGAYVLLYSGRNRLYGPISNGERPIYVGNADSLSSRMSEHRRSLGEADGLDADDFYAVLYPTRGKGLALMIEDTLQKVFDPVWNASRFRGFGSRYQGKNRVNQEPTAWDRIHPGRPWLADRVEGPDTGLRKEVRQYLSAQAPLSAWRIPGATRTPADGPLMIPLGRTNSDYRFVLSDSELAVVAESFDRLSGSQAA